MSQEPLYLDNHLLVLDKPWGLLTQPSGTREDSLEARGKAFLKERFQKPGEVFLEAVHRIDRVVGGVVLFARTSKALSRLNEAQRNHKIHKTYQALVWGTASRLPGTEGELKHWLIHDEHSARLARSTDLEARECRLRYRVLESRAKATLLEIDLLTGRYHQIRAQLSAAGVPICGDEKYGAPAESRALAAAGGIALLSWGLSFAHPVTKEDLSLQTALSL
jgi:23S rRNA pseudouridine1911/1915/1917 synthase